ncbi:AAA family ATPase [Halopseudomonas phragmitis]|uniref:Endonuclease GajA/Old nuclease/RecF-like AAA domain-containing protein n=1 Tax=Halopseudomonas phragmitis TaxID=1931241 RepID=A0A1V0B9C8_9GAMM|nr:AAA family ATPase [Halopseudomonas phragmitis]AQZ96543.1 hypothetical protein BVH74_18095 [Halopseudomonas phragmitis]
MYKIIDVEIQGFWGEFKAFCSFNNDVNIVIGQNGTGKTTFMNILNAVLSVDVSALAENEFESVVVKLGHEGSTRTVRVTKHDDVPFALAKYSIGQKKFALPLIGVDEIRSASLYRRRAAEAAQVIKDELAGLVSLASLSVYRFRNAQEYDAGDRGAYNRKLQGPVDARLQELMQGLTKYQLELSQKARDISYELQREVLMSLLYQQEPNPAKTGFALTYDADSERKNLMSAYKQLGLSGGSVTKRINEHVKAVDEAVRGIRSWLDDERERKELKARGERVDRVERDDQLDFTPIEASRRISKVYELSLQAEKDSKDVFSQLDLFLKIISDFIVGKRFEFDSGVLTIVEPKKFSVSKLSSGEKQLLILLTEAVLQRQESYIFLADEPELSLHIAWQRRVVPAIKSLNPNAQVVVATHSPEIASKYKGSIIDMEDILHVVS